MSIKKKVKKMKREIEFLSLQIRILRVTAPIEGDPEGLNAKVRTLIDRLDRGHHLND